MSLLLLRVVVTLMLIEIGYLILINAALNLPLTQSLINQHRPELYSVSWERAWSWFPFRVHGRGISANGQTPAHQWQVDIPQASADLAVLPLLIRTVKLRNAMAEDVSFRLRPRPKQDKDYVSIREGFPPIENRDPNLTAANRKPRKGGRGWTVVAVGARLQGRHDVWMFNVRGEVEGNAQASFSYESRGGPFSLQDGEADLQLRTLFFGTDWQVAHNGEVAGSFELDPFVPSENRGWRSLGFLKLDANIDVSAETLDFLDPYLNKFNQLQVDGKGQVTGRVVYDTGNLIAGTDLRIPAEELVVDVADHQLKGHGRIEVAVTPESTERLRITFRFDALEAFHVDDSKPLFIGDGLELATEGSTGVLPNQPRQTEDSVVSITIPKMSVPDLSMYQRYLPDRWKIGIAGGEGELTGHALFSRTALNMSLDLLSKQADIAIKEFRFQSNVDLQIRANGVADDEAELDLAGSLLRLDGTQVASASKGESKSWETSLTINQGTIVFPVPELESTDSQTSRLSQVISRESLKELLAGADARLDAKLSISDLSWLNVIFNNPFQLAIHGSGEASADIRVESGWLAKGSEVQIKPNDLRVDVLDYTAQGDGNIGLQIEEGGEVVDMRLDVDVDQGSLRRRNEDVAVIEDVSLKLQAHASNVTVDGQGKTRELRLQIPSARLTDVTVYNDYLPADAPVEFLAGEGVLTADMQLQPQRAGGFLKFETEKLRARIDQQEVMGDVLLDIKLVGGVPREMDFDISGSSLLLTNLHVAGEQRDFHDKGWNARFDLTKARAIWRQPVSLDAEARIKLQDTRPIVAMFANQRGKDGWIEKLLTAEDVSGLAVLNMAEKRIAIPYALASSDKIDVGAKGIIENNNRQGMFYARFKKLHGLIKIENGRKNIDILRARKKFDGYKPGETTVGGEPVVE